MITESERTYAINDAIESVEFTKYINPKLEALGLYREYVDCQELAVGIDYFNALTGKPLGKYFGETEVKGTGDKRHVFTNDSESMSHLKEEDLVNVLPLSRMFEFAEDVKVIRDKREQELADFDASVFKLATELSLNAGLLFAQLLAKRIKGIFAIQGAKKGKVSEEKVRQINDAHDNLYKKLTTEFLTAFPGIKHKDLKKGQYYVVYRDGELDKSVFEFVSLSFLNGSPLVGRVNDQSMEIEFTSSDKFYTSDELSNAKSKAVEVANKSFGILVTGLRLRFARALQGV